MSQVPARPGPAPPTPRPAEAWPVLQGSRKNSYVARCSTWAPGARVWNTVSAWVYSTDDPRRRPVDQGGASFHPADLMTGHLDALENKDTKGPAAIVCRTSFVRGQNERPSEFRKSRRGAHVRLRPPPGSCLEKDFRVWRSSIGERFPARSCRRRASRWSGTPRRRHRSGRFRHRRRPGASSNRAGRSTGSWHRPPGGR